MRALWSGHVTCGLVSVPVRLYAATEDLRPQLHQVHAVDGSRIRHRRVCEAEDREVTEAEIAKGWEAPDGRVVVLADEDLEHLPLATRKMIEIAGFVGVGDVDPLMYDHGYYAAPDGPAAGRPYALLVEALARTGRLGIAKFAVRTRERLVVLRPRRGVLVVHGLHWPQEIRDPGDIASLAPVTEQELGLAEMLIEQLAGVDIASLHDQYGEALDQAVTAKLQGQSLSGPPEPQPVVDLMQALEDSLRQARRGDGW
ncbi:Ku protein [Streptomyces sp. NPDC051976]|uniref:non-homologous end joining protein Ku n=1 Tax=Streptomyces sp. NPDC051976 TaxID=3154947 RepID=UPI003413ADB7